MLVPLGVLSLGAIFAGWLFSPTFIENAGFWKGSVFFNEGLVRAMESVPLWVSLTATVVMLIGLLIAWWGYIRDTDMPARAAEQLGPVYRFLFNKWYFDELYNLIFVRLRSGSGGSSGRRATSGIIDRFGPDGAAWVVAQGAGAAKRLQSGYVTSYALIMLLGLVAAVTWVLF